MADDIDDRAEEDAPASGALPTLVSADGMLAVLHEDLERAAAYK